MHAVTTQKKDLPNNLKKWKYAEIYMWSEKSYTHLEKHSLKAKINIKLEGGEKANATHETSKAEEKQIWILAILLYTFKLSK